MIIVVKFGLPRAGSILFIEKVLQAAVDEERRTRHEREELGCCECRIIVLRHQAIREDLRDVCPQCRAALLPTPMLDRRRVVDLEALIREAGSGGEARSSGG